VTVHPVGNAELIQRTNAVSVRVVGWALDPDTAAAISVQITGPPAPITVAADRDRPDIANAYPGYGGAHGFDTTIVTGPAPVTVCVTALNHPGCAGTNQQLRCQTV
jgi:hypothetical protein